MRQRQKLEVTGLTQVDAQTRLQQHGPNELTSAKPANLLQQSWAVIKQPMLLLLVVAGSINFAIAEPLDGVILFMFVVMVVGISIYQEHKSESALAALRDLATPHSKVYRDGMLITIASRELVVGDLVAVYEGDRIPADGYLISGALQVEESSLTGESVPVTKVPTKMHETQMQRPGQNSSQWLFSGTLAAKGTGKFVVLATGSNTELGRIGTALSEIAATDTPLQKEIDRFVTVIAVIGISAALMVTLVFSITRGDWLVGSLAGIATAMAMLPEEFPVVLTVFLAIGAWRLSKVHVLTRRSAVIETLGSASVICVDKTGTLTQNKMVVHEFLPHGNKPLDDLALAALLASEPDGFDAMDKAFIEFAKSHNIRKEKFELVAHYPLSEKLLVFGQAWKDGNERTVVAIKGAPEAVSSLCGIVFSSITTQVESASNAGNRVLGLAIATLSNGSEHPENLNNLSFEFLGLVALKDPVRDGVPEAIAEAKTAGVRTVMITGDYPGTALSIANQIGIDTGNGALTGAELESLSEAELAEKVRAVSVFARMIPEQKLQLIRALKANSEVVAMTGDGVNDSPALKAADIGIAMGLRGTDVAREAASLVLTDDNFTSIVAGIRQGRTIFENMRKALTYVIAVHIPILGMTLIPVFAGNWPLMLVPALIAFIELIIDPACSVVFEAEAASYDIMRRKPRALGSRLFHPRVLLNSILQGLAALGAVLSVYLLMLQAHESAETIRTAAFVTLVLSNLTLIVLNRNPKATIWQTLKSQKNPTLKWVLSIATLFLLLVTNLKQLGQAFKLTPLDLSQWVIALLSIFIWLAGFEVYKAIRK